MKGWSLANKGTGKVIKIGFDCSGVVVYTVAFDTKKGLLGAIDGEVEYDEKIVRVEVEEIRHSVMGESGAYSRSE